MATVRTSRAWPVAPSGVARFHERHRQPAERRAAKAQRRSIGRRAPDSLRAGTSRQTSVNASGISTQSWKTDGRDERVEGAADHAAERRRRRSTR